MPERLLVVAASVARAVIVLVMTASTAHARPDVWSCCGAERASLGSFFRGIMLGQTTAPTLPPAENLGPDIGVELEMDGTRVTGVVIQISDTVRQPPLCPLLRAKLTKAWGPPTEDRWEAPSRDRAVELTMLDPPSCTLRFFRLVRPDQWLNRSRRSIVPIWAIGKPISQLKTALAQQQPEDQDPEIFPPSFRWQGTMISGDPVSMIAYHARGRVIGIEVDLLFDPDQQAWRRLDAVFGAPDPVVVHEAMQTWRWRRAPGVVLENFAGTLPTPAPGQPIGTQDMHPTEPYSTPSTIVFGVKPR